MPNLLQSARADERHLGTAGRGSAGKRKSRAHTLIAGDQRAAVWQSVVQERGELVMVTKSLTPFYRSSQCHHIAAAARKRVRGRDGFLKTERARWRKVIADNGIRLD
jgi:hypothetical protein